MKLLIVHDASSENLDEIDTFKQLEFVKKNAKAEVFCHQLNADIPSLLKEIDRIKPDLVFNLIENRDVHVVPAIFDALGIKYTGNPTEALFLTTDKLLFRKMLPDYMTPKYISINDGKAIKGKKYIIKAVREEASVGIDENSVFVAENTKDVRDRLKKSARYSFAEEYIEGREFYVNFIEDFDKSPEILPIREVIYENYINDKPKILCFKAKWDLESFEYKNTKTVLNDLKDEPELLETMVDYVKICWKKFGLKGYGRIDFRVDKNNKVYVLDINANSCLILMDRAFSEKGYEAGAIVDRLVKVSLN